MPYIPFFHHADYTAPKFTGEHLDRMLNGRATESTETKAPNKAHQFAKTVKRGLSALLCIALVNSTVPGSAIVDFGKPARASFLAFQEKTKAKQKDIQDRKRKSASRPLTVDEQRKCQGRTGECPYIAGQQKWDVTYKGIDLMTGNYATSVTDLSFDGGYGIPVNVTRSYSSNDADEGPFGKGWTLSADIRSTAGGVLKSNAGPVNAVPANIKERAASESDPNVATQPTSAVVMSDSAGHQETVQRDADGILTTPPWDNNTSNCVYEFVTFQGQQYQILVSDTVTTSDGTIYTYQDLGYYPNGQTPYNNGTSPTPNPSNVLKVTSATDRQGNVTTYTYNTNATVSFYTSNGQVTENPLTSVAMPNGHLITFTWGDGTHAPANRVWKVSDNSSPARVVTYGYTGELLTSVTTPGGKTTLYGYGAPDNGGSSDFLTTITNPQGLVTGIHYDVGYVGDYGFANLLPAVYVDHISNSDGTTTYSANGLIFNGTQYLMTNAWMNSHFGAGASRSAVADVAPDGTLITGFGIGASNYQIIIPTYNYSTSLWVAIEPLAIDEDGDDGREYTNMEQVVNVYDKNTEDLLYSTKATFPFWDPSTMGTDDSLAQQRGLIPQGYQKSNYEEVETNTTYNFMGNPLTVQTVEQSVSGGVATSYRTASTAYAYWDISKYYQQKATQDQGTRWTYTDYFPSSAPAGERGQKSYMWDAKNGQIYLNQSASIPLYMNGDTADYWKYQITAPANTFSREFSYDAYGRITDTWKLQNATTSPWTYTRMHMTYQSSGGAPDWGSVYQVVEDYGGANRTTTNNAYTPWGKAYDVSDAAGHRFQTTYDQDELIQSVYEVSSGKTVLGYSYGTTTGRADYGQVVGVSDGVSGVNETLTYGLAGSGAALGKVVAASESGGSLPSYSVSYTYNIEGDRSTATYSTPYSTNTWGYTDFVPVGQPTSLKRAAQTMTQLNAGGNPTAFAIHYAWDTAGHLLASAFDQTPASGYTPTAGNPWYTTTELPSYRARASYTYDPMGRMLDVLHYWDVWNGSGYTITALIGEQCSYETSNLNRGLRTGATFLTQQSGSPQYFASQWTETYGYDSQLDYLTSFSTTDGQASPTQSWAYDAAFNRTDTVADNLERPTSIGGVAVTSDVLGNRLTFGSQSYSWDVLNRMASFTNSSGTTNYAYRSDGLRVGKSGPAGSSYYFYDGQVSFEDVDTTSTTTTVTDYAIGGRGIDAISVNGTIEFPLYDVHGNVVATLQSSGANVTLANQRVFDPWGKIRSGATTGGPKGRYCANLGHKQDDESGLVYMRSRYYEPGSGRFLIQDPDKQGDNWFVYAADNPVSKIDSTGRDYFDDTVGLFQVLADYAAFLEFVKAYNTATSSLDIENAWGAFMTVWSGPDDTTTNGLLLKEMYGIASSFGDASDASSVTDALKEGALDGAQLIILSVAYDLRLEWYLNDIDDDD